MRTDTVSESFSSVSCKRPVWPLALAVGLCVLGKLTLLGFFFLPIAPLANLDANTAPSRSVAKPTLTVEDAIVVNVDGQDEYALTPPGATTAPVDAKALVAEVVEFTGLLKNVAVYLNAADPANYRQVVEAMTMLQQTGVLRDALRSGLGEHAR